LIDGVTAEIAFFEPIFAPLVLQFSKAHPILTIEIVSRIRDAFCPTASFLSVANTVAKIWLLPIVVLVADWGVRIENVLPTSKDQALRVAAQGRNKGAIDLKIIPWKNMGVPANSPLYSAYHDERSVEDSENLRHWTTSGTQHAIN
jgi:hypothetical protein